VGSGRALSVPGYDETVRRKSSITLINLGKEYTPWMTMKVLNTTTPLSNNRIDRHK